MDLGQLRQLGRELARVYILGKLLVALVCESRLPHSVRQPCLWRAMHVTVTLWKACVYAVPWDRWLTVFAPSQRWTCLRQRPRSREPTGVAVRQVHRSLFTQRALFSSSNSLS